MLAGALLLGLLAVPPLGVVWVLLSWVCRGRALEVAALALTLVGLDHLSLMLGPLGSAAGELLGIVLPATAVVGVGVLMMR